MSKVTELGSVWERTTSDRQIDRLQTYRFLLNLNSLPLRTPPVRLLSRTWGQRETLLGSFLLRLCEDSGWLQASLSAHLKYRRAIFSIDHHVYHIMGLLTGDPGSSSHSGTISLWDLEWLLISHWTLTMGLNASPVKGEDSTGQAWSPSQLYNAGSPWVYFSWTYLYHGMKGLWLLSQRGILSVRGSSPNALNANNLEQLSTQGQHSPVLGGGSWGVKQHSLLCPRRRGCKGLIVPQLCWQLWLTDYVSARGQAAQAALYTCWQP